MTDQTSNPVSQPIIQGVSTPGSQVHRAMSTLVRLGARAPRTLNTLMVVLVAGVVALVFLPAVNNGFIWDDWDHLFKIEYSSQEFWKRAIIKPLEFFQDYYRPLPVASFIAEIYLRGGQDARAMHLTNILLHAFNAALVTVLAYRLGRHHLAPAARARLAAIAAGLIYGCHPALIEATAWISGRFDLLLTGFLLLALLANTLTTYRKLRPLLVGTAFFAAALCKESAAAFPFVLVAWNLAWDPRPIWPLRRLLSDMHRRGELTVYLAVILAGVAYLLLRYWLLGQLVSFAHISSNPIEISLLQKVLYSAETLGRYLFLMVNPYSGIGIVHPHDYPVQLDDLLAWTSLFAALALLAVLVFLIRRNPRIGWLWAAAPLSLLPVANVVRLPIGENIIHDRFLTYPLTVFALALTPLLLALFRADGQYSPPLRTARWGTLVAVAGLIALSIINVRTIIPMWRNDMTFWTWAATRSPDSVMAQANLAGMYIDTKQYALAIEHGLNAVRMQPDAFGGYYIIGKALMDDAETKYALRFLEAAAARVADTSAANMKVFVVLADAYMRVGRYSDAETALLRSAAIAPLDRTLNELLNILYIRTGRLKEAEDAFDKATLVYAPETRAAERERLNRILAGDLYPKPLARGARRKPTKRP